MLEARGSVVFNEKMGDPRKNVRNDEREQDPPPVARDDSASENGPAEQRPRAVHKPSG